MLLKREDIYASITTGGLEIKMPVDINLFITRSAPILSIVSINVDEENPIDSSAKPYLIIVNLDRSFDLWPLAKKYGSTPEMIASANGFEETEIVTGKRLTFQEKDNRIRQIRPHVFHGASNCRKTSFCDNSEGVFAALCGAASRYTYREEDPR